MFNIQLLEALTVTKTCMKGHDITQDSQPILNNRLPVGNLLLSSSILFTGNTFNAMKNFATCLYLKSLSERSFYNIQERCLFPVINDLWEQNRGEVISELRQKAVVKLNGDGRYVLLFSIPLKGSIEQSK